jgi:hypothetical protein
MLLGLHFFIRNSLGLMVLHGYLGIMCGVAHLESPRIGSHLRGRSLGNSLASGELHYSIKISSPHKHKNTLEWLLHTFPRGRKRERERKNKAYCPHLALTLPIQQV